MYGVRKPHLLTYKITPVGIMIDEYFFPFQSIKGFYITQDQYHTVLLIHTDRSVMPIMTLPLHDVDADEVYRIMSSQVPEVVMKEPAFHMLMDKIGF